MRWLRLLWVFFPDWRFFENTGPTARLEVRGPTGHFEALNRPDIGLLDNTEHHLWLLTQSLAQSLDESLSARLLAHTLQGREWRVTLQGEVIATSS